MQSLCTLILGGGGTFVSLELLHIAFDDLGLKRVYLNVIEDNRRAVRLYEKLGFRYLYADKVSFKDKSTFLLWYEIKPEYMIEKYDEEQKNSK